MPLGIRSSCELQRILETLRVDRYLFLPVVVGVNLVFTRECTRTRVRAKTSFAPLMFPDLSLFGGQYLRESV